MTSECDRLRAAAEVVVAAYDDRYGRVDGAAWVGPNLDAAIEALRIVVSEAMNDGTYATLAARSRDLAQQLTELVGDLDRVGIRLDAPDTFYVGYIAGALVRLSDTLEGGER
jgi:hypothetical protein